MKTLTLDINIEGYSGPFDLLCSLSEHGKFQMAGIKISQLIKIYGLSEFFYMASGLILEKTRSLFPGNDEHESEHKDISTEHYHEFMKNLKRYVSYRDSFAWLQDKFNRQQSKEIEIKYET
jgi:chromatin segregation and condensation protein Rec8/ScpA/Scc1 (kleisin family)